MKTKDIFMYGLGALIVCGFFGVVILLMFIRMPEPNEKVLYMVLGGLIVQFGNVVTYFYGSSKGSADKNEMLKK